MNNITCIEFNMNYYITVLVDQKLTEKQLEEIQEYAYDVLGDYGESYSFFGRDEEMVEKIMNHFDYPWKIFTPDLYIE